ncbi:MAG: DUF438 domain-containing protein [Anaerolineae bacterium]
MSEFLHNQDRKALLKQMILDLHAGADIAAVKPRFQALIGDISAVEIAALEQELISEGLAAEKVKALCDVHVAVFRESLDTQASPEMTPGHPVHTFKQENWAISELLVVMDDVVSRLPDPAAIKQTELLTEQLAMIKRVYLRKENLLFPMLERHGVGGPSSVMWGIHNDVRASLKELQQALAQGQVDAVRESYMITATAIRQMIYKEEHILYPTSLKMLSEAEWVAIRDQSAEIGFCLIQPGDLWQPQVAAVPVSTTLLSGRLETDLLPLSIGALTLEQITLMLGTLPVDITYVDENDTVRYFSQGRQERVFPRSPAIIGRKVQNCHPPKSLAAVNRVVEDLRSGKRDNAEFWIQMAGKFIHIRYFALRDAAGVFRGTIEVSQDVTDIRALQGERRLIDES